MGKKILNIPVPEERKEHIAREYINGNNQPMLALLREHRLHNQDMSDRYLQAVDERYADRNGSTSTPQAQARKGNVHAQPKMNTGDRLQLIGLFVVSMILLILYMALSARIG